MIQGLWLEQVCEGVPEVCNPLSVTRKLSATPLQHTRIWITLAYEYWGVFGSGLHVLSFYRKTY